MDINKRGEFYDSLDAAIDNFDTNDRSQLIPSEISRTDGRQKDIRSPCKGRKCVIMFACLMLQFFTVGYGYGLSVMYVEIIRAFNSPRTEAALIQSLYFGIMTGGGVCWAWLVNLVGPGPCVVGGSIAAFLGLLISSFAVNVPMVVAFTGGFAGAGMSLCYLGSFITVSWIFHENPGVSLVFLTTGSSLGQVVMPYIIDVFITEYQWFGAFQLLAALALNCVACGLIIYTSREFYHKGSHEESSGNVCDRVCDRTLLTDITLLMILVNVFLLATTGPIEAWFLVDLMVQRGYDRETGSLFVSLTGFSNFLGRGVGGLLRLFCKVPTVYHWVYLAPVVAISHLMVVSLYDYWSLFAAAMVYGISFGVTVAQEPAIMFEASGLERYPKGIALLNLMYGIGNFVGGLIGGIINDELGSYDVLFYIAIGASCYVSIATIAIIVRMRRAGTLHRHLEAGQLRKENSVRYVVSAEDLERAPGDRDSEKRHLLS